MPGLQRHPSLVPLSHDHHHGLVAAQRLKRGEPAYRDAASLRDSIRTLWESELREHFAEEEEIVFNYPGYDMEVREMTVRALCDHEEMRAIIDRCDREGCDGPTAQRLGELLEAHIRFEERELFPRLQSVIPAADLTNIGERIAQHRDIMGRS